MKSVSAVVLLAVAAAVGCSGDSPVGVDTDGSAFRRDGVKMVPFKGHHEALATPLGGFSCPAGQLPGVSAITEGDATHLGTYTGVADGCIRFLVFLETFEFVSASLTWVAANGDEVYLTLNNAPQTGVFPTSWQGGFDVDGGTGRFYGATGQVSVTTAFGSPNVTSWEGTISAPGSIQ